MSSKLQEDSFTDIESLDVSPMPPHPLNWNRYVGEDSFCGKAIPHEDAAHLNIFLQREAKRVARNPCTYMCTSIFLTLVLSVIGFVVGDFAVVVENEGWWSRGTIMSDRNRQASIINTQKFNLAYNQSAWNFWLDPNIKHIDYETLVAEYMIKGDDNSEPDLKSRSLTTMHKLLQQAVTKDEERRLIDQEAPNNALAGCDLGFYSNLSVTNLWPIWKMPKKEYETTDTRSILEADVLEAICLAETNTQSYLEENGLCDTESRGCDSGKCIPPYSIVLYARLRIDGGLESTSDGEFVMDCRGLSEAWTPDLQELVRDSWIKDIKDLKTILTSGDGDDEREEPNYPYGYYPALVQHDFDTNGGRSQYSSSIFDTGSVASGSELFERIDNFDTAEASNGIVKGAYDTGLAQMALLKIDLMLPKNLMLSMASAFVIAVAIMLHTQSPLVAGLGLLQIILSFPMAYFFYSVVLGLPYFPFLNFIGIFVVFALGAGDIFISFDKWTNYRKNNMTKSSEYVAAYALPEALSAMFLTTLTTAIAFFASAVCPVTPIKMFAIFCGLLIICDYVLTVCFVFPALCIYDQALIKHAAGTNTSFFPRCWMGCVGCGTCFARCSHPTVYDDAAVAAHSSDNHNRSTDKMVAITEEKDSSNDTENYNPIQRFMLTFSQYLHRARWPLLLICSATFVICCSIALKLSLPESSEPRLLKPDIQFEQNYIWKQEILSETLNNLGSLNAIMWGLDPSDTAHHNDPHDGTALVLDETFDPSSAKAQVYLKGFCDNLFENDFAWVTDDDYVCPINKFDKWLKENYVSEDSVDVYNTVCGSPDGIPVDSDKFHACMTTWASTVGNFDVLSQDGIVKYIRVPFINKAVFTDTYEILQEQFDAIEGWTTASIEGAPKGVNQAFFTSTTYHFHETNASIQKTAYSAAGISLLASAIIILFSSQSVVLTLLSTATILFILVTVTALLVSLGWTLGFLESICFSILIGISADFVIHMNHAYVNDKGEVSREERTKYAMITMGPSILITAGTTFFSAIVMLFCTITFFHKFAQMLFFTVIISTLASFVVFPTLTNCFGPYNPTYLADKFLAACCDDSKTSSATEGVAGDISPPTIGAIDAPTKIPTSIPTHAPNEKKKKLSKKASKSKKSSKSDKNIKDSLISDKSLVDAPTEIQAPLPISIPIHGPTEKKKKSSKKDIKSKKSSKLDKNIKDSPISDKRLVDAPTEIQAPLPISIPTHGLTEKKKKSSTKASKSKKSSKSDKNIKDSPISDKSPVHAPTKVPSPFPTLDPTHAPAEKEKKSSKKDIKSKKSSKSDEKSKKSSKKGSKKVKDTTTEESTSMK